MELDRNTIHQRVAMIRKEAGPRSRLLAYAISGIQRFIFTSSRLRAIHESSRLICEFDREILSRYLRNAVFAGGGRGLLLVREESILEIGKSIKDLLFDQTSDATVTLVDAPFDAAREQESLRWLWTLAATRKDAADPPRGNLPTTYGLQLCVNCRKRDGIIPAERRLPDEQGRMLCEWCANTIKLSQAQQKRGRFSDVATAKKLCVIAADGNGVGRLFESLPTLESLACVSEAIKAIFPKALGIAAPEEDEDVIRPITGGDDIRAILGPAKMSQFIDVLQREIHRHLDGARSLSEKLPHVGLGMGVIVAPEKFPILRLFQAAESAEAEAKKHCRENKVRSAIQIRLFVSGDDRIPKPLRPVSLDSKGGESQWTNLLKRAKALSNVPSSQRAALHSWFRDRSMTESEALNLFRYQIARTPAWKKYFEEIGKEWQNPQHVKDHRPEEQLEVLADLGRYL